MNCTPERRKQIARYASSCRTAETFAKIGLAHLGHPNTGSRNSANENNAKAVDRWHFIHKARGLELKGKNLANLIRENSTWFTEKQLKLNPGKNCNAATGLRQVAYGRGRSYHGWTCAPGGRV